MCNVIIMYNITNTTVYSKMVSLDVLIIDTYTLLYTGCRLEMVGSSVSGFCMKTSDINIDVVMDENLNPSIALLAVRELVRKNDLYT